MLRCELTTASPIPSHTQTHTLFTAQKHLESQTQAEPAVYVEAKAYSKATSAPPHSRPKVEGWGQLAGGGGPEVAHPEGMGEG